MVVESRSQVWGSYSEYRWSLYFVFWGWGDHGHWLCYAPSLLCPKANTSAESLLTNIIPDDITFYSVWSSGGKHETVDLSPCGSLPHLSVSASPCHRAITSNRIKKNILWEDLLRIRCQVRSWYCPSAHLVRCIECAEASGLERYQNISVATEDLSHYSLSLAVICFSNVMKITFTAAESHLRLQRNPSKQVASVRLARLRPEEKTQETLRLWGFGFFSHSTFAEKEIFQRKIQNVLEIKKNRELLSWCWHREGLLD